MSRESALKAWANRRERNARLKNRELFDALVGELPFAADRFPVKDRERFIVAFRALFDYVWIDEDGEGEGL